MAELLQAQGARRIVLKNIGSKMLGKLLGSGLAVYQASQGRLAMADMLSNESGNLTELTSAEQGSASRCAEGAGHHGKGSRQCAPRGRLGKGGGCKSASGQQQGCQGNRQRNHKKCCEE
ncbi:NifB/NifX family molybdenum-iron cluster-binding protein [Aeromonas sp. 23P]|uniref:NifB/NifX family molybdenum-iron cluster-binding protein n=1 Tax=Aeromonas sp. 23P TaxID=3452716 RepID=UPI003F79044D